MSWQSYSDKFEQLTTREQVLMLITGLVAIVFVSYFYVIDGIYSELAHKNKQNVSLASENNSLNNTIVELQAALQTDHNAQIKQQISQYKQKLEQIDQELLTLTSKLVDPIQMRQALEQLLQMQKGVKLLSFEVSSAEPLLVDNDAQKGNNKNTNSNKVAATQTADKKAGNKIKQGAEVGLYRHKITLKLSGSFFKLQHYLAQVEQLPWRFFWEKFDYKLTKYPNSELEIEIYSLSLKREFIGV